MHTAFACKMGQICIVNLVFMLNNSLSSSSSTSNNFIALGTVKVQSNMDSYTISHQIKTSSVAYLTITNGGYTIQLDMYDMRGTMNTHGLDICLPLLFY